MIASFNRPTGVQKTTAATRKPRLGFLGASSIGSDRLEAIARSRKAEIAAIADPELSFATTLAPIAKEAKLCKSLEDLLSQELDGISIATPTALHAQQAEAALDHGLAVFCERPLGRNELETSRIIAAAKANDRLLGVDLSHRHLTGIRRLHQLCRNGDLGDIYAVELMFHNAHGPDRPWWYNRDLSGGGCVIDLGSRLVDLALWNLGFPTVTSVSSRLCSHGKPLSMLGAEVEDYAVATLNVESGAAIRLACSWKLPVGCNAIISASFYGTGGAASCRNLDGSFYDFVAERFEGTKRMVVYSAREDWSGRAAVDWAGRLSQDRSFDPDIENVQKVAAAIDAIYRNA